MHWCFCHSNTIQTCLHELNFHKNGTIKNLNFCKIYVLLVGQKLVKDYSLKILNLCIFHYKPKHKKIVCHTVFSDFFFLLQKVWENGPINFENNLHICLPLFLPYRNCKIPSRILMFASDNLWEIGSRFEFLRHLFTAFYTAMKCQCFPCCSAKIMLEIGEFFA
jgi:hypothetical protein